MNEDKRSIKLTLWIDEETNIRLMQQAARRRIAKGTQASILLAEGAEVEHTRYRAIIAHCKRMARGER